MRDKENACMEKDIEYLEKAFKKWTPHMLSSPYIPTPSVLVKNSKLPEKTLESAKKLTIPPTTKPINYDSKKRYENIIDCLHKGAQAYTIGDYGTAINCFIRLLEIEWLKHSTYFYLVKTIIKLDIEKEILSLKTKSNNNNIRMTKSKKP